MQQHVSLAFSLSLFAVIYEMWMRLGSRFRNWFQGAPYTGALLNMNNCGLERQNGDLKENVDKNAPLDRFFFKVGTWLRDKSLAKNPASPNFVPFQVTPIFSPSLWVETNYIYTESKRNEEQRFQHVIQAYVEGTPEVPLFALTHQAHPSAS